MTPTRTRITELLALARASKSVGWPSNKTNVPTLAEADHIAAWSPAATIEHLEWLRELINQATERGGCGICGMRVPNVHTVWCQLNGYDDAATPQGGTNEP